ncbi:MAG: ATP-binding protein [Anaerolineae bacterium]|nr:ATP-binding protein [Thermoflexales bacterium]MDW8408163.1 ATP-binding protein [Anaerolineae bacterium]
MDYSFAHLNSELVRINLLVRRAVHLAQQAGHSPDDPLRGLYLSDDKAVALSERPLFTDWLHQADRPPQEQSAFDELLKQVRRRTRQIAQQAQRAGVPLRLDQLRTAFGLDDFEYDALLIVLAPALDWRFAYLYGYLQDDITRKQASPDLILDLLCPPGAERLRRLAHFVDNAPLFRSGLLTRSSETSTLLGQLLQPAPILVPWLIGASEDVLPLAPGASVIEPDSAAVEDAYSLLTPDTRQSLIGKAMSLTDVPPVLVVWGDDPSIRRSAVLFWAHCLQRPVLVADTVRLAPEDHREDVIHAWMRDARLLQAVLWVRDWERFAGDVALVSALAEMVQAYRSWLVLEGSLRWHMPVTPAQHHMARHVITLRCDAPDFAHRRRLWRREVERMKANLAEPIDDIRLAGYYPLNAGQIRAAVVEACNQAFQSDCPLDNVTLLDAARAQSSPALGNLARQIIPRYTWDDLVLPEDQLALLRELATAVRNRPVVLQEWGVGHKLTASEGITVLFAGPPGAGKTMAAEVIAADLRLDLYKIDLSAIVNKYIGETEKNLERIFTEAEHSNAILFFDEADAIFGKRSEVKDAHDRYANIEVSYLLQRMEAYNGVTILATNLRANLDEAFIRRLQFAVDFPFPDEAHRLRIWQTLFGPNIPRDDSVDFVTLSRRFKLAGGNIRNIIVGAAYLAVADGGCVTMRHVLHSARRELQKMGRLVNEQDLIV